ncbi:MAG TPA: fluoride efflux transporter CrcB [Parvularculaceae bacterium]|nr:fluoride efflux transporter CrcB [Parvularculaceae bacterium]HNS86889.1 fluoride efflux transporter CrcB [Parvularculaceae bacterium]
MSGPHLWLAVGVGGGIGAMARYGVGALALRWLGPNFPWGTLGVNVVGSAAMGLFIAWLAAKEPHSSALRVFVATGVLGGFTTFSAFALDAVTLYRDRTLTVAGAYVAASVVLSIAGLFAGLAAGKAFQ